MSTAAVKPMTVDDFLRAETTVMDGVYLELIDGELVERPMTTRSPQHALAVTRIGQALANWLDDQPTLEGAVYSGDVRCCLRHDPDTVVGIDVGVWYGENSVVPPNDPPLMGCPPSIAIEVLSPSDTHENVTEKTRLYLECGVAQVWIADPDFQTVTIYRPNLHPRFFHVDEYLTAMPELPGFSVRVDLLFSGKKPAKR